MRSLKTTLASVCLFGCGLLALGIATRVNRAAPAANPAEALSTPSQRFTDVAKAEDPSFRRHVVPLLARQGCSARECHGSFQGRGGFQLSLFGSEWDQDFVQLTQKKGSEDEIHINAKEPEKSLILLKPTMQMKHKGKERFKKDSWQYNMILKWVRAGAKNDADKTGELKHLEVTPSEMVFKQAGQSIQLRVIAHWTDGTTEDVTEITRFKTNDETVASVTEAGLVAATGKGDSHVVVSYDNGVVPIPVMLPVSDLARAKFPPASTKIDEVVGAKLQKVGILPSEFCTDSEFLRRVSLDLTGTLPTPDEVTRFIADSSAGKRSAKVDELLKSPSYAAWWTTKLCDYTGNNTRNIQLIGNQNKGNGEVSRQWYDWLYKRVAENTPYDKIVADIVLATSRSSPQQSYKEYAVEMDSYFRVDHPADFANHPTLPYFWQRRNVQQVDEKALAFAHTFMGVRIECAQCHKHPFDRWTKADFKEFSAFFGSINTNQRPAAGEEVSFQSITKEIRDKVTAQVDKEFAEASASGEEVDMKGPAKTETKEEKRAKKNAKPEEKKDDAKSATSVKAATADVKGEAKSEKVVAKGEATEAKTDPKAKPGVDAKADIKLIKGAKLDDAAVKLAQKKNQRIQKLTNDEVKRRIDAGEPAPWSEVWANTKNVQVPGKNKGGRVDPSIKPRILGGEQVALKPGDDARQPLMDWLKSKSNPYFAKSIVNRVWANYFHRGIVDPPDDMNIANAPCNGELLNYLADGFVEHQYDMKWLHREILTSDTYQRSWKTNATNARDLRNFSHAVVRQLPAEVMLDAIDMAVAPSDKAATFATNMEARAIGPVGASLYTRGKGGGGGGGDGYFLTLFGRPTRETNCDCERSTDPTLLQTLFTRNDPSLLSRIEGQGGKNSSWIAEIRPAKGQELDLDKSIVQVFLRTVSRPPTIEEMAQAHSDVAAAKTPIDGVRDLLWTMLNTREFKVNH